VRDNASPAALWRDKSSRSHSKPQVANNLGSKAGINGDNNHLFGICTNCHAYLNKRSVGISAVNPSKD
jgi:hypothetical protein